MLQSHAIISRVIHCNFCTNILLLTHLQCVLARRYENVVPIVLALSSISGNGTLPLPDPSVRGLDLDRMDNTFDAYRRLGYFLWQTDDPAYSAMVANTHINISGLLNPPFVTQPPDVARCDNASSWRKGADALEIGAGPDICMPDEPNTPCANISTPGDCCALCSQMNARGGTDATCHSWFFNGDAGARCHGHGCCFVKSSSHPDHVTAPNPSFYAGLSSSGSWCPVNGGSSCAAGCGCAQQDVIGKYLGWEIGYAAYRQRWTRLIALHRWLGAAAHVENTTLFAESYDYECLRTHAWKTGGRCWGDPGNGVQIGWFLWGEAIARRLAGLPVTPS